MLLRPIIMMAVLAVSVAVAMPLAARNVDLSTVPDRDTVQLTIYNSEDLTLVRETRKISFKQGVNALQFSWANTLIDPSSVELGFLTHPDKLDLLDTTFPHDKPQMLYWNVQSELDGEAVVEIKYFTSGIRWTADYVCVANPQETHMSFDGYVRVYNNSGEEYEDAQVRLVVGTINLVQKIAELAKIPMQQVIQLEKAKREMYRGRAVMDFVEDAEMALEGAAAGAPGSGGGPKQVIKEGLSEYFIYTIEGTETIPNGWSKRLRSLQGADIPFAIQYRYRAVEYGDQLVRMYLLANDTESELGTTPLPDGIVRVFRENGRDGLSFLVAQHIKYVPIGDKIELNLGADPEVIFERIKLRAWREGIWMHIRGANVYRRVDDDRIAIDVNSTVAGWQDHAVYTQRIRNYSGKEIDVEVRRTYTGHMLFRSSLDVVKHDYQTVQFQTQVGPGETKDLLYQLVRFHGYGMKQNNVTIETAEVEP
jgi:hypothetical protein